MSLQWSPLRRGVRGIVLSMLVLMLVLVGTVAHASDEVAPTGTEPSGGGCILTANGGEMTSFCGPDGSFNEQCGAYWRSVTGDPNVWGEGWQYGSLCFGSGSGNGRIAPSMAYTRPTCPRDARVTGNTCTCRPGTGADPTNTTCWPVIDIRPPHDCPLCELLAGNPIVPLRGVKKEFVDTGLRVGHLPLTLTYDTTGRARGVPRETAAQVLRPHLSTLWFSSFHRHLVPQAGYDLVAVAENVSAQRGDGRILAFQGRWESAAVPGRRDRLRADQSTYQYGNAQDNSREVYDKTGQLQSISWADGARATFTYSTASWAPVGNEGDTIVLTGRNLVRYGGGENWIEKTVEGSVTCTSFFFGYNPAPYWQARTCQLGSVNPANAAPAGGYLLSAQDERGRSVAFRYDAQGRITRLEDPAGQAIVLGHDEQGNLQSLSWPDGRERRFVYENSALPWALTGVVDENGARYSTFNYNPSGGAVSTELAGGVNHYEVDYGSAPEVGVSQTYDLSRQAILRTHTWAPPQGTVLSRPNGSSSALGATSVDGKTYLSGQSQAAGAGCTASTSGQALDANGNPVSRDDFNGTRSCYVHDPSRFLLTDLVEGLAQSADCVAVTPAGATLPATARRTTTQWHPDWSFATKVATPRQIITSVYNGQPDPFNGNATASCEPGTAPLPDGKPIVVLCKQVTQATTDADGHLGFGATLQAGAAMQVSTWTYNESGQVLTAKTTRSGVTVTTNSIYFADTDANHTKGDLQSITSSTGEVTIFTQYNRAGQVLQRIDPNGILTVNTYDLRQRLLSTTVDGLTTTYEYDAVGQLKKATQPNGGWVGQDYDDAHRLKAVYDDQGNRIDYELNPSGQQTGQTTKDPNGSLKASLERVMDALSRAQRTTGGEE